MFRRTTITIISDLVFEVYDPDGNDITAQIQTPEVLAALSEQLGPTFQLNINNDGETEIGVDVRLRSTAHACAHAPRL